MEASYDESTGSIIEYYENGDIVTLHYINKDEFTWRTEALLLFLHSKGVCHEAYMLNIKSSSKINQDAYGITEDSTFTYVSNSLSPGWEFSCVDRNAIHGEYILSRLGKDLGDDLMHFFGWDEFRHQTYDKYKKKGGVSNGLSNSG